MICLKKPTVTAEQIKICETCKFASGKKIWCCKWGFYFKEPEKIHRAGQVVRPAKSLILPGQHPPLKPTILQMAADFGRAMIRWGKSGLACVTKDEYIRRRSICSECTDGWRCPHCGCMLWAKVALTTEKCPQNKW
jgi:hypothetical protein